MLEADNASYDDVKQVYTLTGNVVLTKGTMVLKSDAAELRTDPEGYQYAIATAAGQARLYPPEARQRRRVHRRLGRPHRVRRQARHLKLIGQARMARLAAGKQIDEIRGAVITYDSNNEYYTASSSGDKGAVTSSGRVRAVLSPRQPASAPAAPPLELKPAPAPSKS